jgi:hypothetical protein
MALGSNNPFPKVILVEGSTPSSPSAGRQSLFLSSTDNRFKRVNSSGSVHPIEPILAVRSSTQSFTSDSLADITGFSVAVAASEVWICEGWLFLTNAAATGDFKYGFTYPASPTKMILGGHRLTTTTASNTEAIATSYGVDTATPTAGISAGGATSIVIAATLINGSNAGTWQLQGAQNTTDGGNATVLQIGSWVRFTRVS